MAKNNSTVYLGFDDEEITAKHAGLLNSTVNKIGGMADWPSSDIKVPLCTLCGTTRPLIVQLYAPLEHSQFHRTLYIFGCLNPMCSQNSKAWTCIRTQHLDTQMLDIKAAAAAVNLNNSSKTVIVNNNKKGNKKNHQKNAKLTMQKISWCSGADDWGSDVKAPVEDMDTSADEDFQQQQNEENGNIVAKNDNSPIHKKGVMGASLIGSDAEDALEEEEDDEDESNSMENDIICGFGQLDVNAGQALPVEDPNANCAAAAVALGKDDTNAVGMSGATAIICAEIEGSETDLVLVETPKKPQRDLVALLKHTSSLAALGPLAKITDVTLKPYFMAVDVEPWHGGRNEYDNYGGLLSSDHIRELYQDYKRQDEAAGHSPIGAAGGIAEDQESYEKSLPAHGDIIFHQFVSTLQQNPGQILRYSRDTHPLLIASLNETIPKCPNCNGETICEVQILPTLIPKLRLQQNNEAAPIEFGNVLVFTCLKGCWDTPDKMRYERVLVQAEK